MDYQIVAMNRHNNDALKVVLYKSLYYSVEFSHNSVWVRFESEFKEKITVDDRTVACCKKINTLTGIVSHQIK